MSRALRIVSAVAFVLTVSGFVYADWDPGDPHKMTVPQLPDPNGLDVDFNDIRSVPPSPGDKSIVLADDWICSQTGKVTDVHFWVSFRGQSPPLPADQVRFFLDTLHVSIHDDGVGGVPGENPDHPDPQQRTPWLSKIRYSDPNLSIRGPFPGQQGWWDPNTQQGIPNDHLWYYQVNLVNLQDVNGITFFQKQYHRYWLDLQWTPAQGAPLAGWKTSDDGFGPAIPPGVDDYPSKWRHHYNGQPPPLDQWEDIFPPGIGFKNLAFVITPEPSALALMGISAVALLRRR